MRVQLGYGLTTYGIVRLSEKGLTYEAEGTHADTMQFLIESMRSEEMSDMDLLASLPKRLTGRTWATTVLSGASSTLDEHTSEKSLTSRQMELMRTDKPLTIATHLRRRGIVPESVMASWQRPAEEEAARAEVKAAVKRIFEDAASRGKAALTE